MALKDKATFIAGIQAFCDGLNAAFVENGGSGMASELLNPMHPLRQITKLFKVNDSGVLSSDDSYIDRAYDGDFPSKGNELDKELYSPPTLYYEWNVQENSSFATDGIAYIVPDEVGTPIAQIEASWIDGKGVNHKAWWLSMNRKNITIYQADNPANFLLCNDSRTGTAGPTNLIYFYAGTSTWNWSIEEPPIGTKLIIKQTA